MNTRAILSLFVIIGMVVTTAGGTALAQTDSTQTGSGISDDQTGDTQQNANYTRLYIEDRHEHLELKPGETDTVTVTVENGEDETVELSPQLIVPPRGQPPIKESWVTFENGDATLAAGETQQFKMNVSVPTDAEPRRYGGMIAFTDERIQMPDRPGPARPVHGVTLNVEVWQEPTIHVDAERHTFSQVQAGESFTTAITVENTGEQAVPLNPQMKSDEQHRPGPPRRLETLDRSWVTIDAPSEIGAGESKTINVTVAPPADAERGDYNAEIDLGLTDPARNADRSHWQELSLRFQVWSQPEQSFERSFKVSESASKATLKLTADQHSRASSRESDAGFDVTFVAPDGTEVDAERVQLTDSGHVSLGDERQPSMSEGTYASGGVRQEFTYRVDDPEAGMWSVRIMPKNTMEFGFEIIRTEG